MTNGHKPLFVFEDEDDHSSKKAVAQKAPEASPGRNVRPSVGLAIQQLPVMHFVAYNCLHCCDALCCLQLHCCDAFCCLQLLHCSDAFCCQASAYDAFCCLKLPALLWYIFVAYMRVLHALLWCICYHTTACTTTMLCVAIMHLLCTCTIPLKFTCIINVGCGFKSEIHLHLKTQS